MRHIFSAVRRTAAIPLPQPPPRSRLARWIQRYGLAEVAGLCGALLGAALLRTLTGSDVAAAYGGSLGENVGFYGVIVGREVWQDRRAARDAGERYRLPHAIRTSAKLMIEFGVAELLDSTVVRPLAMGLGMHYLGRELGVLAGKAAADVLFYIPVITAYEWRRRLGEAREP
jgi:hypothetical protein